MCVWGGGGGEWERLNLVTIPNAYLVFGIPNLSHRVNTVWGDSYCHPVCGCYPVKLLGEIPFPQTPGEMLGLYSGPRTVVPFQGGHPLYGGHKSWQREYHMPLVLPVTKAPLNIDRIIWQEGKNRLFWQKGIKTRRAWRGVGDYSMWARLNLCIFR